LIWNNLFLIRHPKRIHGSRGIFEKRFKNWHPIISARNSIGNQILPAAVLLLELERLYDSYVIDPCGRNTFLGAALPAKPPKLRNSLGESTFPQQIFNFCNAVAVAFLKNWISKQIARDFSHASSNAPWSEIIYFWYATQNEFMDHEKSSKDVSKTETQSLGARGKPSTIVYRAGWLVEPSFSSQLFGVQQNLPLRIFRNRSGSLAMLLALSLSLSPSLRNTSASKLGARGKPSTFVYRAGWLVEPSPKYISGRDPLFSPCLHSPRKSTSPSCVWTLEGSDKAWEHHSSSTQQLKTPRL